MTLEEWAQRVDEQLVKSGSPVAPHAMEGRQPAWSLDGRSVAVRVAEDDASLRASFRPRGSADPVIPERTLLHQKLYFRGDASAREAARDIVAFLTDPE